MAYFFRLIIFVFISFVSLPSQALLSTQKQYLMSASGIGNFSSDSASGVCGQFVSAWGSVNSLPSFVDTVMESGCSWGISGSGNKWSHSIQHAMICPENTQASGNGCACQSGFIEENGKCVRANPISLYTTLYHPHFSVKKQTDELGSPRI